MCTFIFYGCTTHFKTHLPKNNLVSTRKSETFSQIARILKYKSRFIRTISDSILKTECIWNLGFCYAIMSNVNVMNVISKNYIFALRKRLQSNFIFFIYIEQTFSSLQFCWWISQGLTHLFITNISVMLVPLSLQNF